jgi:general secretion pathway protein G
MIRRIDSDGFTLLELMIVVAIVAILGGIAIPAYLGYLDKARIARTIAEIRHIEKSIKLFYATTEVYPTTLAEVAADKILDPWGTPYQYLSLSGGVLADGGAQDEPTSAWSWFAPSSAYATPSSHGQGNGDDGGNSGGGGNRGRGKQNSGRQNSGTGAGNGDPSESGSGGQQSKVSPRKDRFGVPLNTDFDLYSMGKDRLSSDTLSTPNSHDDILRANDGAFVGLASHF